VIVCLLAIMAATAVSVGAVVHWWIPHEAVLQGLISLFVPLKMPDHFLLFDEHPWITIQAMKVLPATKELISVQRSAPCDKHANIITVVVLPVINRSYRTMEVLPVVKHIIIIKIVVLHVITVKTITTEVFCVIKHIIIIIMMVVLPVINS